MIRYIAVTESADHDESQASYIPENQIERIDRDTSGKATLIVRECRETAREGNDGYGTREWRIDGYESQERYSVMKFDDLIAWLNGIPRPLMLDISPEEARHIKATLEDTQRTLDSITIHAPRQTGLDSDVFALVRMLKDGEYAEHWAATQFGQTLEAEITKLIGHDNAATNKLQRAEQLLAEIHHAVNNDGGLYPIGPDSDLVARLSEYLYPDSTNC